MYKLNTNSILRSDGAHIPLDPANSDYATYLVWLSKGNIPDPADIPIPSIPSVVEMAQARLALLHAGYLDTVSTAIAGMSGTAGDAARIEWEFRANVHRGSALVVAMSQLLTLNSTQLDALFVDAAGR